MRLLLFSLFLLPAARGFAVDISTYSSAGCAFPDTDQSLSYTATFGEDHDYASSVSTMSFTVYNPAGISSVTVDNRTGLMWITNPATDAGFNNPGPSTWNIALSSCEALTYAGYTDWRLPNMRELSSIVDYSQAAGPRIDSVAFPGAFSSYYWTSTTYAPSAGLAFYVSFAAGAHSAVGKGGSNYVRCVRGGP